CRCAGGVFALFAPCFSRGQHVLVCGKKFLVRSQLRSVRCNPFRIVCNACRCAGGVFALFAPCFSRGQHVLVRGKKFLRRSKLRSIRRSCDQCGATVFAPIPDRERVEP